MWDIEAQNRNITSACVKLNKKGFICTAVGPKFRSWCQDLLFGTIPNRRQFHGRFKAVRLENSSITVALRLDPVSKTNPIVAYTRFAFLNFASIRPDPK